MSALVIDYAANTSLGDAVTACAAARAGMMRPIELDGQCNDPEEGPVPLVGYALRTVSGFQGESRLLALALPALRDLMSRSVLEPRANCALFLALPDLLGRTETAGLEAKPVSIGLLERIAAEAGLSPGSAPWQSFHHGPTGFARALQAAFDVLANGSVESCIVGAIDSLCDGLALAALEVQGRLKTPENPVGLRPGEAAAFLLLEARNRPRSQRGTPRGSLTGVTGARDPRTADDPPRGEGLSQAIAQLVTASGPLPAGESWFVLDRNGEVDRAQDWAWCQLRLAQVPGLLPAAEWDPALSFGDTGAAASALGIQMALQGFARGYAPGRCAVVLSSSSSGERDAIRVERTS